MKAHQRTLLKMEHLMLLAKKMATVSPALSRFYMSRLGEISEAENLKLDHKTVVTCPHCSSLLVPGSNCTVRIASVDKRRKFAHRQGALKNESVYHCQFCSHNRHVDGARGKQKRIMRHERNEAKAKRKARKRVLADRARTSGVDPVIKPGMGATKALPKKLKSSLFFQFQCDDTSESLKANTPLSLLSARAKQAPTAPATAPKPKSFSFTSPAAPSGPSSAPRPKAFSFASPAPLSARSGDTRPKSFSFSSPSTPLSVSTPRSLSSLARARPGGSTPAANADGMNVAASGKKTPGSCSTASSEVALPSASSKKRRRKSGYLAKEAKEEGGVPAAGAGSGGLGGLYDLLNSFK